MRALVLILVILISACSSTKQPSTYYVNKERKDESLELLKVNPPVYPQDLLLQGIEGYVIFEYDINKKGRVVNVELLEEHPYSIFRAAAMRSLKSSRYKPKLVDGKPVMAKGYSRKITFVDAERSGRTIKQLKGDCTNGDLTQINKHDCLQLE